MTKKSSSQPIASLSLDLDNEWAYLMTHGNDAWKSYPTLEPLPGPQLPTGYAGCLLLAMLPPLWYALMHPRLDKFQENTALTQ